MVKFFFTQFIMGNGPGKKKLMNHIWRLKRDRAFTRKGRIPVYSGLRAIIHFPCRECFPISLCLSKICLFKQNIDPHATSKMLQSWDDSPDHSDIAWSHLPVNSWNVSFSSLPPCSPSSVSPISLTSFLPCSLPIQLHWSPCPIQSKVYFLHTSMFLQTLSPWQRNVLHPCFLANHTQSFRQVQMFMSSFTQQTFKELLQGLLPWTNG